MNNDQKFGLTLLVFCITMWFLIIPTQVMGVRESIFPRFITVWIVICSFFLMLRGWKKGASKRISPKSQDEKRTARVAAIAIIFLIYILIIGFLGFFIPSFLFLVMAMLVLGVRNWRVLILVPGVFLGFVYLFMERILVFPLPKGTIF